MPALVPMMFLMSPLAQLASNLMSSPAPVGMFLICNAAITEPPHLVSGWPEASEKAFAPFVPDVNGVTRPAMPPGPVVAVVRVFDRALYEPFTSCSAPEIWNRPQA